VNWAIVLMQSCENYVNVSRILRDSHVGYIHTMVERTD